MFSVIIPLYNKEVSIKKTIQSVLDQSFADFEIVVVNDGSTDNSKEVVEAFDDARIRLINKENGGVSSARNRGIKEAKYDWIAFLDGDDLWVENHLEEFSRVILKNGDLQWLFSGYTECFNKKKKDFIYPIEGKLENVFNDFFKGLRIHTSAVCIEKVLFEKHPALYFREGMNNSEDREVWYKLCCIDISPYNISKPLSVYDVGVENSLTKSINMTVKEHFLSMLDRLKDFDEFMMLNPEDRRKIECFIYQYNSKQLNGRYVSGNFKEEHRCHLPYFKYLLFRYTSFLPLILRRIINRLYNYI